MNLTCPSCGVTFFVESGLLGPAGRRVRCGDCRHTWHQEPVAEEPAPAPAPEPAPEDAPEDAPEPAPESAPEPAAEAAAEQAAAKAAAEPFAPSEADTAADGTPESPEPAETPAPAEPKPPAEAAPPDAPRGAPAGAPAGAPGVGEAGERVSRRAFAKPARPQRKKAGVSLATGWAIYAVVAIGLASGFYYGRAPLVAAVPEMTRLYELLGLEEEVIELGLELRDLKSVRRLVEGERVVVIEGQVVNLSNREHRLPLLYASVTDADGAELDRWTFSAASASLPPGGTTRFETVAKNTPRGGNVFIDFVVEK